MVHRYQISALEYSEALAIFEMEQEELTSMQAGRAAVQDSAALEKQIQQSMSRFLR